MPRAHLPQITLFDPLARFEALLQLGEGLSAVPCAVVHPCSVDALRAALQATERGLIEPLLIGPESRLRELAEEAGLDLAGVAIDAVPHSHAAAARAAELATQGRVEALMKGSLHTDELVRAVQAVAALQTQRRMSHVFRLDVPTYPKPLLLTDCALNIRPGLHEKADIVQNAIGLAQILGTARPKVAVLAAVETVQAELPSTLDAAALCQMARRGQITGGLLDGPLAFDNAISPQAARLKHLESEVAGEADVLVVPDLESGNLLANQLEYLAGATACGVALGARVPIALTSRADGVPARVASALLAKLVAHRHRRVRP